MPVSGLFHVATFFYIMEQPSFVLGFCGTGGICGTVGTSGAVGIFGICGWFRMFGTFGIWPGCGAWFVCKTIVIHTNCNIQTRMASTTLSITLLRASPYPQRAYTRQQNQTTRQLTFCWGRKKEPAGKFARIFASWDWPFCWPGYPPMNMPPCCGM